MLSLFLRNLFFTMLQPGIVAGLIPYMFVKEDIQEIVNYPLRPGQWLGMAAFIAGLFIMFHCIWKFAVRGKGTLSPADPTKRLVISGLYRYSRNPMYVGVMLILIGESLIAPSTGLWIYSTVIFIAFYSFIIFFEEPRLTNDFGDEYIAYRKRVRRWL